MKNWFVKIVAALGFVFLYLPVIILILYSFNDSKLVSVWGGFSFRWYEELWKDHELLIALLQSVKIASISASLGVIIGVFAGVSLSKYNFFSKSIYSLLVSIPLVIPEIIIGLSLLILFQTLNKLFSITTTMGGSTIIIAHTTICISYVALLVQLRINELNKTKNIEEAALDLGATPLNVFLSITLPSIKSTIISGWFLAFILSFDDLIVATFTSGPGTTTLPMLIYSRVRLGLNPEINVMGTITILLGVITSVILFFIKRRKI